MCKLKYISLPAYIGDNGAVFENVRTLYTTLENNRTAYYVINSTSSYVAGDTFIEYKKERYTPCSFHSLDHKTSSKLYKALEAT